ncbi:MAG TPA: ABC transporter permease [Candidatus Scybalocola faecavium]|nr:ABC transporter permease [Candidatus Scybalocola faecavium]
MTFYKRGFLYLIRKRGKSLLLFFIFLLVSLMILGTTMILHGAAQTKTAMEEKSNAKVVCEITDTDQPITSQDIQDIRALPQIRSLNRIGDGAVSLSRLAPITQSDSGDQKNSQVRLRSFDDLNNDSPFSDGSYRLTQGQLISPDTQNSVVVNEIFAQTNGLSLGDEITLENSGATVTATVIGLYLTGNETRQDASTLSVYRMENQIFSDQLTWSQLMGDGGYIKVSAYTSQPELLNDLAQSIRDILQDKGDVTTSDALFRQMSAPLTQITRVVSLMRILAFITGTAVISLILAMWMRSRQREMAILISLGEYKSQIFLQALLESVTLYIIAAATACPLGFLSGGILEKIMTSAVTAQVSLQISLQPRDIFLLFAITGITVIISVCISVLPVIRTNPKDILSRMEG